MKDMIRLTTSSKVMSWSISMKPIFKWNKTFWSRSSIMGIPVLKSKLLIETEPPTAI